MDKLEMAEKLVEKCGISYEEAGEVLREADFDLLEAMIILERRGKMRSSGNSYSTSIPGTEKTRRKTAADAESFGEFVRIAFANLGSWFNEILKYRIIIMKEGREVLQMPLLLGLFLVCCSAGLVFAAALVSVFAGCSYVVDKAE
ncbi:MAG: hypothetical protein NC078_08590 [Ruminococcus sp.]|nr:hypothetical protein [Ruminococcus sp.]